MVCVYCGSSTQVINSRPQKQVNQIWRRRQCSACGNIFTTHEQASLESSLVVRAANATLAPFSRDRLFVSIYESCKHRPSAFEDAAALAQTCIARLTAAAAGATLQRDNIVTIVGEILENFDTAAATFYRAYHPIKQ